MIFRKKDNDDMIKRMRKPLMKQVDFDKKWIISITIMAFLIGSTLSFFAEITIPTFGLIIASVVLMIFILLGIVFDVVGVAIMMADIEQFHSMAAKKMRGAKLGIKMINKKEHVANFCSDVVGDICGILSGSAGLVVASYIANMVNGDRLLIVVLVTAVIGALMIGGKAIGKAFAANLSNYIIYEFAKTLSYFYRIK